MRIFCPAMASFQPLSYRFGFVRPPHPGVSPEAHTPVRVFPVWAGGAGLSLRARFSTRPSCAGKSPGQPIQCARSGARLANPRLHGPDRLGGTPSAHSRTSPTSLAAGAAGREAARQDRAVTLGTDGGRRHAKGPRRAGPFRRIVPDQAMILVTRPEPTVRPPSRMAKPRPSSMAIGWISATVISVLSPGMTISVPSGSVMTPVTSVVRK